MVCCTESRVILFDYKTDFSIFLVRFCCISEPNPKHFDPSYKTDLDYCDCLIRKTSFITEEKRQPDFETCNLYKKWQNNINNYNNNKGILKIYAYILSDLCVNTKQFISRDSLLVPAINCLTSFYAGFVIFASLGFMAHTKGVSVDKVAQGGKAAEVFLGRVLVLGS